MIDIALAALIATSTQPDEIDHHPVPMPTCQTEDSSDCAWDAREAGNLEGRSFTAITTGRTSTTRTVTYIYWDGEIRHFTEAD